MKSKTLSTLLVSGVIALTGVASPLYAEDKLALTTADATMQQTQRKAVMGISRVGLESNRASFPVFYTPAGKDAKTILIGNWSVTISQSYADSVLADNYSFLIPNRYDKLIFNANEARVITPTQNIQVEVAQINPLLTMPSSYKEYQENVLEYLNSQVVHTIEPLLSAASEERYAQMSAKESETFITTKAKELGMSAAVLERLINSAFSFSVYMQKVQGSIYITQNKYQDSKGRVYIDYTTSIMAPLTLHLNINEFSNKHFTKARDISSSAGMLDSFAKGMSASSSVTTSYMPGKRHAQKIFDDAFKSSFKDNIIALSTRLKEDRAFAITTPLHSVSGASAMINVGNQEDIRVDHPFKILRTLDGEERIVAYMKVQKSGDNCMLLPKEKQSSSEAYGIIGSIEEADLAVEYPWSGVFTTFNVENRAGTFKNSTLGETKTGEARVVNFGMSSDLGYVLNSQSMSEVWFNFGVGIGSASYKSLPSYGAFMPDGADAMLLKLNFGFEKRYNLSNALYLSALLDFDYEMQSYGYESGSDDGSLSLNTFSLTPMIKLGYMFSPSVDIYGGVGYNLPLVTDHSFTYGEESSELPLSDSYEKDAAPHVLFGVNIHVDFAGPFSRMFAKPSKRCDSLKNQ